MEYRGSQVFIIHPDDTKRDELVDFLRNEEYEAFGFGDTDPLKIDNSRESVVFFYVGGAKDWNCKELLASLSSSQHVVHLVALGGSTDADCFEASVVDTNGGLQNSILEYLKSAGARGHRHFVRFGSQNASIATFDFHDSQKRYAGIIHDISVRGISCTFRPEPDGSGPRKVNEMNLNLPGHRSTVSGRMTTRRVVSGQIIRVFIFDKPISEETIDELHEFIYASLSMKLSSN